ncbi:hypothetical protein ABKN59_005337 [Abortiporus biennis]
MLSIINPHCNNSHSTNRFVQQLASLLNLLLQCVNSTRMMYSLLISSLFAHVQLYSHSLFQSTVEGYNETSTSVFCRTRNLLGTIRCSNVAGGKFAHWAPSFYFRTARWSMVSIRYDKGSNEDFK